MRSRLWFCLLLSGCVADARSKPVANASRWSVRDSASISIITIDSIAGDTAALRIQDRPFRELGGVSNGAEGELDGRSGLLGANILSNGTVVVHEFATLKFVDGKNIVVRTVGRPGSGPGEFTQIREVCVLRGDSLLVIDSSDGRLSLWDSSGVHIRTYARPGYIPFGACAADGMLVVRRGGVREAQRGREAEYDLASMDGTKRRSLGWHPLPDFRVGLVYEPAFLVNTTHLIVADAHTFEFRFFSTDSQVRKIVRSAKPPQAITDADWQRLQDGSLPKSMPEGRRRQVLARMMALGRPSSFPAFSTVRRDRQGRLWIGDAMDHRRWTVLDSAGLPIGAVQLPWPERNGLTMLVAFGEDYVVIRRADDDGGTRLSFHRIVIRKTD
jgi:hypothetical protein